MIDQALWDRLAKVERKTRLLQIAPTLPIYDITNFPQDAVETQLTIGSDDNLYWFSSGSWQLGDASANTVTVNSIPQDILEGQLVICLDGSGIAWYVQGSWYGLVGHAASGNPPQDAINGQIAIGNSDNLCWCIGQTWYST